jgi:lysophospholipase L1-like esterase
MRLMIVGDSHTRDMDTHIKTNYPHTDIMMVTKPRSTAEVIAYYMRHRQAEAVIFDPNWIIIHCGHNDVVQHHRFNKNPQFAGNVTTQQVLFARNLQAMFPTAVVMCSSLFPRTPTDTANLTMEDTSAYNRVAKRYGLRLRALTTPINIRCSLNMTLWTQVAKSKEAKELFSTDGLHLTNDGKVQIGVEWIKALTQAID